MRRNGGFLLPFQATMRMFAVDHMRIYPQRYYFNTPLNKAHSDNLYQENWQYVKLLQLM